MHVSIRDPEPADIATIVRFNAAMAQETESKVLDAHVLERGVRAVLEDPGRGRYWLAEDAGQPIGQVMITREWSDWRDGWFWWLQSVYVAPTHRRRGVFRALYRRVRDEAARAGARGLRLYVEHDNRTAANTYRALGMADAGYAMLEETFREGESTC